MPKPKTISEIEKMFDEKFKHSQFVDYSKIKSFLRTAILDFYESVRPTNLGTKHMVAYTDDEIYGFNQALVAFDANKAKFMGETKSNF